MLRYVAKDEWKKDVLPIEMVIDCQLYRLIGSRTKSGTVIVREHMFENIDNSWDDVKVTVHNQRVI